MPFYNLPNQYTKATERIYTIYDDTFVITPGNYILIKDCFTEVARDMPTPKDMPSVAPAGNVNLHAVHSKIFDFLIRWEHPAANPSKLEIKVFEKELTTTPSILTRRLYLEHQGIHKFSHHATSNVVRIQLLNRDLTALNNISGELKITWRFIG